MTNSKFVDGPFPRLWFTTSAATLKQLTVRGELEKLSKRSRLDQAYRSGLVSNEDYVHLRRQHFKSSPSVRNLPVALVPPELIEVATGERHTPPPATRTCNSSALCGSASLS